ncbi:histidine phosphatase family protein [Shewanella intestini]|uniref:Histidine phosphatase family protein n=1 Tax=Shewanella intestini TaxID=2017544 RepID=A0ABS5I393_9GAMM|nr:MULTISPECIES: histidine phosphatase family protein [Shewanella]MBR9728491.1 hypothetical protein [Shewanella intestini]MRG36310.1 hypothetical protein [Shewanella sp. XMDDZSB0408]
MKKMKLWLLRHGKCEGGNILRGQVNVPLADEGIEQMNRGFNKIGGLPGVIVSSSLQRCANWSQTLANKHGLTIKLSQALTEISFGDWDGQTFDQLYADFPEQMDAYWHAPWDKKNTAANGEHLVDFQQRVLCELASQLDDFCQSSAMADNQHWASTDASMLIVTHGGVIKAILAHILNSGQSAGLFSQFSLPYGALLGVDVYVDSRLRLNPPPLTDAKPAADKFNDCQSKDAQAKEHVAQDILYQKTIHKDTVQQNNENNLIGYQFSLNWPES